MKKARLLRCEVYSFDTLRAISKCNSWTFSTTPKPLIFCLPDRSRADSCFCPKKAYRALSAKARLTPKPYFYGRAASFGYVVANTANTIVRRSHMTTHLILLPGYAAHGRKLPCFSKSSKDNDKNAAVHRSHLTTRLIQLPGHTTSGKKLSCLLKSSENNDKNTDVRRSHSTTRLVPQNVRLSLLFIVEALDPQLEACFFMR